MKTPLDTWVRGTKEEICEIQIQPIFIKQNFPYKVLLHKNIKKKRATIYCIGANCVRSVKNEATWLDLLPVRKIKQFISSYTSKNQKTMTPFSIFRLSLPKIFNMSKCQMSCYTICNHVFFEYLIFFTYVPRMIHACATFCCCAWSNFWATSQVVE